MYIVPVLGLCVGGKMLAIALLPGKDLFNNKKCTFTVPANYIVILHILVNVKACVGTPG